MNKLPNLNLLRPVLEVGNSTKSQRANLDIDKMVREALANNKKIYVHPVLFSDLYKLLHIHIDRPYNIDPLTQSVGSIQIVVSNLIPKGEFRILSEIEFEIQYKQKDQSALLVRHTIAKNKATIKNAATNLHAKASI